MTHLRLSPRPTGPFAWPALRALPVLAGGSHPGESASRLSGRFEHFVGDPEWPTAWDVSTYAPLYKLVWSRHGPHTKHRYRAGGHVIETAHAVGFLAPANRRTRLCNPEPTT